MLEPLRVLLFFMILLGRCDVYAELDADSDLKTHVLEKVFAYGDE